MYQEKIEAMENEIVRLEEACGSLCKEWVEKHHPLKIGGKVIVNGCGYAGEKMIVDHIFVSEMWGIWKWRAFGKVIKKNGKVGTRRGEWSCPVEGEVDKI